MFCYKFGCKQLFEDENANAFLTIIWINRPVYRPFQLPCGSRTNGARQRWFSNSKFHKFPPNPSCRPEVAALGGFFICSSFSQPIRSIQFIRPNINTWVLPLFDLNFFRFSGQCIDDRKVDHLLWRLYSHYHHFFLWY